MRQITKTEFLNNYETGHIIEVVAIGTRVYGRDLRKIKTEIVWCNI